MNTNSHSQLKCFLALACNVHFLWTYNISNWLKIFKRMSEIFASQKKFELWLFVYLHLSATIKLNLSSQALLSYVNGREDQNIRSIPRLLVTISHARSRIRTWMNIQRRKEKKTLCSQWLFPGNVLLKHFTNIRKACTINVYFIGQFLLEWVNLFELLVLH